MMTPPCQLVLVTGELCPARPGDHQYGLVLWLLKVWISPMVIKGMD